MAIRAPDGANKGVTSPIVYATIAEYEFKKHQLEKYRYNQGKVRQGDFINKYS